MSAIQQKPLTRVLAQDAIGGTMFERVAADWIGHLLGADSVLHMPEIGIELPLAELYDGVDVTPAETGLTAASAQAPQ
jgi:hypothetical protein